MCIRDSSNTYSNLFVYDAEVRVWTYREDGTIHSSILRPIQSILLPPPFDTINVNNLPPVYTGFDLFGEIGKTYFLEVKWNNNIITSSTTIPEPTPLDCVWVEKNPTAQEDYACYIRAVYSDPAEVQNNVLIRSKRLEHWKIKKNNNGIKNNNDDFMILVDAGPDVVINGQTFETYFPRPEQSGGFPTGNYFTNRYKKFDSNGSEDSLLLPNDIALIKFCQIDQPSLRFWRGVVRQVTSGGNPFAEPANLSSNIEGGLGSWTGYGTSYYKVPIIVDTTIFEEYTPGIQDIF